VCAIAGRWFFCRYSPFPAWIRVLFPFTYFMAFQYAVVARPYVLLPLFTFAAAHTFADADFHPWRFVAATSAMALLCAPGTMIAIGLMAARTWYVFRSWSDIPLDIQKRMIAAALVFAVVLVLLAFINWPPADRSNVASDRITDNMTFGYSVIPRDLALAFFGSPVPCAAFLIIVVLWCACRRRLAVFVLPTVMVLGFLLLIYGNLWHTGALTFGVVAALWIGWPLSHANAPKLERALNVFLMVGLGALLGMQI
jgi:hypothetical protein